MRTLLSKLILLSTLLIFPIGSAAFASSSDCYCSTYQPNGTAVFKWAVWGKGADGVNRWIDYSSGDFASPTQAFERCSAIIQSQFPECTSFR